MQVLSSTLAPAAASTVGYWPGLAALAALTLWFAGPVSAGGAASTARDYLGVGCEQSITDFLMVAGDKL